MTLKEYLSRAEAMRGMGVEVSDTDIAARFLMEQSNPIEATSSLIVALTDKTKKMQWESGRVIDNLCMPHNYYFRDYPYDIATQLDYLTTTMKANKRFTAEQIEIMKGIEIKQDKPCWFDLAEAVRALRDNNYKEKFAAYTVENWKTPEKKWG